MKNKDRQPRPAREKKSLFKTEADMCDSFRTRARATGYEVYPEQGGWDLLLVWTGDAPPPTDVCARVDTNNYYGIDTVQHTGLWRSKMHELINDWEEHYEPGMQIGIQAKLRPNIEVLSQVIDLDLRKTSVGPDFRAVLVPYTSDEFNRLAEALGVRVYVEDAAQEIITPPRVRWELASRIELPPIVPAWSGGKPSPRVLSAWRVGALKICALLRSGKSVTKDDFRKVGIEIRTWVSRGWIVSKRIAHRQYVYTVGDLSQFPDIGYEAERDAIAALHPIR